MAASSERVTRPFREPFAVVPVSLPDDAGTPEETARERPSVTPEQALFAA
jgi:hypothetical protein